jgi:uncharacterized protein YdeI (YjbR/CyaY-like superfamily)
MARKSESRSTTSKRASLTAADRTDAKSAGEPVLSPSSATEWHAWLRTNHARSTGVLLRIPKKSSGSTLTYAAALEAALAWGWIDSQKQALDDTAWLQRFTPRTSRSPWSKINRAKAEALIASGRMEAPGLTEVDHAKRDGRWERAYDGARTSTVPSDLAEALEQNARARAFFETLDAANRYAILYRVTTAKLPETRAKRVATFVAMCAAHETLHPKRTKASPAKSDSARRAKSPR